jgi:chemotaxis protein methyltransferase CheR
MELSNIDPSLFENELINNPENFNTFINEIVVNSVFRDPDFFKSLLTNVFHIYKVILQLTWSAGCSFGEETYSLAILLKEMDLLCKSRLYATDISTKALINQKRNLLY